MFKEHPVRHKMNRRLARTIRIERALMADGSSGVVIYYGDRVLVLSDPEAVDLLNVVADTMEAS